MSQEVKELELEQSEEEQREAEAEEEKRTILELGSVLVLDDPVNLLLHQQTFVIDYIDHTKTALININTGEKITLAISPDGIIGDGTIQQIQVISRHPEKGFARQHGLVHGAWIDIHFGGDIPVIITGRITNLEEDMIEINTTDHDTIYINFQYQGIPEDLPITSFRLREAPVSREGEGISKAMTEEIRDEDAIIDEEQKEGISEAIGEAIGEEGISEAIEEEKGNNRFFNLNDLQFGEVIRVDEFVTVDKNKHRYNLDTQTNDMLEDMLSSIPPLQRTDTVLKDIHQNILRFIQLRQLASTFDVNHNVTGVIKRTAEDKPLADYLASFQNTLYWLLIGAKSRQTIYRDEDIESQADDYEILVDDHEPLTRFPPFVAISPDDTNNVFAVPHGIIAEGNVETNMNVMANNLNNNACTVMEMGGGGEEDEKSLTTRRFVIQRYQLAEKKTKATNFKGKYLNTRQVSVGRNDAISVNAIFTLPEPTVRFSQINLPGSNLYTKSNLNRHFLNYWQLLKQHTNPTHVVIDGLDTEIDYDDANFVDDLKQYTLDLTEYAPQADVLLYPAFLNIIIPKIKVLFLLIKKYIRGRLSFVHVLSYLEPFLIYPNNITFGQGEEIKRFLNSKIMEYNGTFNQYNREFAKLAAMSAAANNKPVLQRNVLDDLLSTTAKPDLILLSQTVDEKYGENPMLSQSERWKKILFADYGVLYQTAVALTNRDLMFPSTLSKVLNESADKASSADKEDKACATTVIAKKYVSKEKLELDNGQTVYFDRSFDTTNYELLEKYQKEKNHLTPDEFLLYLTNVLHTKERMDEAAAEYLAQTLIDHAKAVREGDYAILVTYEEGAKTPEHMEYYVRRDDRWTLDTEMDPSTFIQDPSVLCNTQPNCNYDMKKATCLSTDTTRDNLVKQSLKNIIDQFDRHYDVSQADLQSNLNALYANAEETFEPQQKLRTKAFLKDNDFQYHLGTTISTTTAGDVPVSPYIRLRDAIVGQGDFLKQQRDIIKFVELFAREGDPTVPNIYDEDMESSHWFYCRETNTKLLPAFRHQLAMATTHGGLGKYTETLEMLKRTNGVQSDDGNAWVDKYSGEIICYIDLDTAEGGEGFGRRVLEMDAGEQLLAVAGTEVSGTETRAETRVGVEPKKTYSAEGQMISNIISTLENNMGIHLDTSRDFIVQIVSDLMYKVVVSRKEEYLKKRRDSEKEGKKVLPPYERLYHSQLIYATLGGILLGIQTSMPPIRTNKTAPGCIRSLTGFPMDGEGDDSSLDYVSCVAVQSRDSKIVPWNELSKSPEDISKRVKKTLLEQLLKNPVVQQKMREKAIYLTTHDPLDPLHAEIPPEYDLARWTNFLPPLKRFHLKQSLLTVFGETFKSEFMGNVSTGNPKQQDQILVIHSKIMVFSLAVQEAIQRVVDKQPLLLKSSNQFFMENACCNDNHDGLRGRSTIQYFIDRDPDIERHDTYVYNLTTLIYDLKFITKSKSLLSRVNTKRPTAMLSSEFSEETIYATFIHFCKFLSSVPLPTELMAVCHDKPNYLKKMETIQEKIAKLKRDGRMYDQDGMKRLLELVGKSRVIRLDLSVQHPNYLVRLNRLLETLDAHHDERVPRNLITYLGRVIIHEPAERERMTTSSNNDLKNFLQKSIVRLKKTVSSFIDHHLSDPSVSRHELAKVKQVIATGTDFMNGWNLHGTPDGLENYAVWMKNQINAVAVVFPSAISQQTIPSLKKPPKYWGFAPSHNEGLTAVVAQYYHGLAKCLEQFGRNVAWRNALQHLAEVRARGFLRLAQNTPVVESETMDGECIVYLLEYYWWSVLTEYTTIVATATNTKKREEEQKEEEEEDEEEDEDEEEPLLDQSEVEEIKSSMAMLLVVYLQHFMKSKKMVDVTVQDIQDKMFKSKEAEKHNFTDQLKELSDELRQVDNILKMSKLGKYDLGKGVKDYDPARFDFDKKVASKVAIISKRLGQDADDDDAVEQAMNEEEMNHDIAWDNQVHGAGDDDDADPWEEDREYDDTNEYD